jgi:hypothetical protein
MRNVKAVVCGLLLTGIMAQIEGVWLDLIKAIACALNVIQPLRERHCDRACAQVV